jgi:mRNA interferase HicA
MFMNGAEFIRKARRIGRSRGVEVRFVAHRGKGSHGTLYLGDRHTIVKDRRKELGKGLLAQMLSDLGIAPNQF